MHGLLALPRMLDLLLRNGVFHGVKDFNIGFRLTGDLNDNRHISFARFVQHFYILFVNIIINFYEIMS